MNWTGISRRALVAGAQRKLLIPKTCLDKNWYPKNFNIAKVNNNLDTTIEQ
jgi:hypothetical protein